MGKRERNGEAKRGKEGERRGEKGGRRQGRAAPLLADNARVRIGGCIVLG